MPTYSVLSQSGMAHISSLVSNMAAALQILWVFPKLTTKVNKSLTMPAYVNGNTPGVAADKYITEIQFSEFPTLSACCDCYILIPIFSSISSIFDRLLNDFFIFYDSCASNF